MQTRFACRAGILAMVMFCLAACSETPVRPTTPRATTHDVAGASAAPTTQHDPVTATSAPGLHVTDARPARDKAFSMHSIWITSCDYGVYTVGEPAGAQAPLDVLRSDIVALTPSAGSTHDIRIDHYAVYFNPSRKMKGMAVGVGIGGAIGGAIGDAVGDARKGSKCPAAKMAGGWYGPGELTTPHSPLVVEVAGALDGKPFHSRTVYSPAAELGPKIKTPAEIAAFETALHKANHAVFVSTGLIAAHEAETSVVPHPPAASPVSQGASGVTTAQPAADDEGWINMPSSGAH